ncbi:MAG: hypothetical protein LC650_03230 [Actinobacteria bacterium]|nr:hypothetical protein [Actinomycetota bacterium]
MPIQDRQARAGAAVPIQGQAAAPVAAAVPTVLQVAVVAVVPIAGPAAAPAEVVVPTVLQAAAAAQAEAALTVLQAAVAAVPTVLQVEVAHQAPDRAAVHPAGRDSCTKQPGGSSSRINNLTLIR